MHCKHAQEAHTHMNRRTLSRIAVASTTTGFALGLTFLNGGAAQAIGGLCNGMPASHTWLDASGQYGPSLIDGTDDDDIIVGSDGDDRIDAGAGDDMVCGGPGHNHIHGGPGDDVLVGAADHDHLDGGEGHDTVLGHGGDDTVAGGPGCDFLSGGSGDDVMISTDQGHSHGDEEATAHEHDGIPYEEACEGHGEEPAHEHPGGEEPGHEHPDGEAPEEPGHEHPVGEAPEEPGHEHPEGEEPGHDHGVEAAADDHGDDADHEHGDPREFDEVWAGDGFDLCFFNAGDEVVGCEY
jgi:Ca2+-binding RTX toxin-like protein